MVLANTGYNDEEESCDCETNSPTNTGWFCAVSLSRGLLFAEINDSFDNEWNHELAG